MTKYLVTPINTVKKSIEEVTAGNLGVSIPEFGNNCAGRLIPGIIAFPATLRRWCVRSGRHRKPP
jgi:methyl-accepting chemotaxis protein